MINCSSPSFFKPENEASKVLSRLIGYQANGSSMEHDQLDQSADLQADDLTDWGERIADPQSHMGIEDPRRLLRDRSGASGVPGSGPRSGSKLIQPIKKPGHTMSS